MKNFLLSLISIVLLTGAYFAASYWAARGDAEAGFQGHDEVRSVETAIVERGPIRATITYPGSVMARETVSIAPRVTGVIKAIHVEFGDFVKRGDPLVDLDDREYVERLKQAQANLSLAQAQLRRSSTLHEHARREYDRIAASGEQGISSRQQLDAALAARDAAKADLEVAQAEVDRVRAAVEEAQLNVDDTTILSPLAGWVAQRNADPGTLATSSSPVLTIVDTDPAEVLVYLPEQDLQFANPGRPATVTADNGALTFEGKVARVAPSLSVTTRTAQVIVGVSNPDRLLRPGMSADVTLVTREEADVLVVPEVALVFESSGARVFVIDDGKAHSVPVTTGIESGGVVQVVSGVDEGDHVITKGQFMVDDGDSVKETQAESDGDGLS